MSSKDSRIGAPHRSAVGVSLDGKHLIWAQQGVGGKLAKTNEPGLIRFLFFLWLGAGMDVFFRVWSWICEGCWAILVERASGDWGGGSLESRNKRKTFHTAVMSDSSSVVIIRSIKSAFGVAFDLLTKRGS